MGDPVPFSVLNERLRPRIVAMERLGYSPSTVENQPHQPGEARDESSTTTSTTLAVEQEFQTNGGLTVTEDQPQQDRVVTEGLTPLIEECSSSESLVVVTDYLVPCLTTEDVGSDYLVPCLTAEDVGSDYLVPCLTAEDVGSDYLVPCLTTEDVGSDYSVPCLTAEDMGPADLDESRMESAVPSLTVTMEGDGPDREGNRSDPGEVVREGGSPSRMSYIDGTLPDLIRSGRPLGRRRTLGPVSDTLKEVRREVELSRRRSLKLKAQVDKLQEGRDGPGWSQHRERVTDKVLSVLRLLVPLTEPESTPAEPSGQENRLDAALTKLQHVARKLAVSHTAQHSTGMWNGNGVEDGAVLQQALRDRDEAMDKKKAMETELLRSKTEMMLLNNQLLEAVQKRLELSLELEAWKEDVQIILQQQVLSQQQAEAQRKPSRLGLLRRTNKPPMQRPASIPVSKPPTPTPKPAPPIPVPSSPSLVPQRTWRDRLKRGKAGRHGDQDAGQGSPQPAGGRGEEGFHNLSLD